MATTTEIEIIEADLGNTHHGADVLTLLQAFAMHPGGGSHPYSDGVAGRLIQAIDEMPGARVFLAQQVGRSIGVALCLTSFSSFRASRSLNIHDLYVVPEFHGMGVGRSLIERVTDEARASGYCSVTLEVLENNEVARALYGKMGFVGPGGTTYRLALSLRD